MRRGFTLIEVLLYTALLGIILGTFVLTTATILEARAKSQTALMLNEGARYAMERIALRAANASAVTEPAAGVGSALTLTMPTPSQNPTAFTLSGGIVMIAEGGGPAVPLTGSHLEVTALSFTRMPGTPPTIRVVLDARLRNAQGKFHTAAHFEQTISTRR